MSTDLLPREKARLRGIKNLFDWELLALIINNGNSKNSAIKIAKKLQQKFNLQTLSNWSAEKWLATKGIGTSKAYTLLACFELAQRLYQPQSGLTITNAESVYYLLHNLATKDQEHLVALFLNGRKQLIDKRTVSIGSVNQNIFSPRDVLVPALKLNAAALILAHNHPSQNSTPSEADIQTTASILASANLVGIPLIDHLIITHSGYFSFRENKLI